MALLLIISCFSGIQDEIARFPTLTTSVLIGELSGRCSGIERMEANGLVIFVSPEGEILYFNFADKSIRPIAVRGQGPAELNGGYIWGSVIENKIVVSEIASFLTKSIGIDDYEFQAHGRSYWQTKSLIKLAPNFIVGVVFGPGKEDSEFPVFNVPRNGLALYEILEDGTWDLHGTFYDAEIMGHLEADRLYSRRTELFNAATPGHFYRLPKWASPVMQVMDVQGNIVREFPIPHPDAHKLPKNPAGKLLKYKEKRTQFTVLYASVDEAGILHLLLHNLGIDGVGFSGRVIVKIDEKGKHLGGYLLDRRVRFLTVSADGKSYFALDSETHDLVHLTPI